MRLRTLLGDYPHTAALKSGAVLSDLLQLDFADCVPISKGFKLMLRDQAFDVSEMAVATLLMARSHGKPLVLLPAAMMARFPHGHAVYNAGAGGLKPRDLEGMRVGVRSITSSTVVWLRGILANDHGVDLSSITWVSFEEPHLAEYDDPTIRAPQGRQILPMLLDGELDAVLGETCDDARARPLFADAVDGEQAWFAKHGVMPLNHMVVVSRELSERHPEMAREAFRMIEESRRAAGKDADTPSLDREDVRRSLRMIASYCAQQGLIPDASMVDELLDEADRVLDRAR